MSLGVSTERPYESKGLDGGGVRIGLRVCCYSTRGTKKWPLVTTVALPIYSLSCREVIKRKYSIQRALWGGGGGREEGYPSWPCFRPLQEAAYLHVYSNKLVDTTRLLQPRTPPPPAKKCLEAGSFLACSCQIVKTRSVWGARSTLSKKKMDR